MDYFDEYVDERFQKRLMIGFKVKVYGSICIDWRHHSHNQIQMLLQFQNCLKDNFRLR